MISDVGGNDPRCHFDKKFAIICVGWVCQEFSPGCLTCLADKSRLAAASDDLRKRWFADARLVGSTIFDVADDL